MAITLYGVDPSIDEAKWAALHALATDMRVSGLAVTAGVGTRVLSVGTGDAYAAGVLAQSTTAGTVTLATNTSGQPRVDYVVMDIDWTGTQTTGGLLRSVTGTPGSSPVAPNLTQVAGTRWQIPLARVTLGADNTSMTIEQVAWAATRPIIYSPDVANVSLASIGFGNGVVASSVTVNDPGWRYRIEASAAIEFGAVQSGYGRVNLLVDGTQVTSTRSGTGNSSMAFLTPYYSAGRAGRRTTVSLQIERGGNIPSFESLTVQSTGTRFAVVVHPAI